MKRKGRSEEEKAPRSNGGGPDRRARIVQKKICVLGSPAVGKTCLIRRFVHDLFTDKYLETIGAKVSVKELTLDELEPPVELSMLIWDLAGQDFYQQMRASYYQDADGALIACDLTRPETFSDLDKWIQSLLDVSPHCRIILLGNKKDLEQMRAVKEADLVHMSRQHETGYFLTSAKTGEGVEEAFRSLALKLQGGK